MKFDKFVKKAVPFCATVNVDGVPWCKTGLCYARIPAYLQRIGAVVEDELLPLALDGEIGEQAELVSADLPAPDAKSKDIVRTFSDGDCRFQISNELFSFIERYDQCYISVFDTDEGDYKALLVGKPVGNPDDFEPDFVIIQALGGTKDD